MRMTYRDRKHKSKNNSKTKEESKRLEVNQHVPKSPDAVNITFRTQLNEANQVFHFSSTPCLQFSLVTLITLVWN